MVVLTDFTLVPREQGCSFLATHLENMRECAAYVGYRRLTVLVACLHESKIVLQSSIALKSQESAVGYANRE